MEYCGACINCKEAWSAQSDLSCHDFCDKFKKWRENNGRTNATVEDCHERLRAIH